MKGLCFGLVLAAIPGSVSAQSTYCQPYLNGVQCQQQGDASPNSVINNMLSQGANAGSTFQKSYDDAFARKQAQVQAQQQQNAAAEEGANARREAAYARVGDLIAKGDCDGAKRLARFYNHEDIIRDTDRACP